MEIGVLDIRGTIQEIEKVRHSLFFISIVGMSLKRSRIFFFFRSWFETIVASIFREKEWNRRFSANCGI